MEKKGDQLAHNISGDGRGDEQTASCVYPTPVVMTIRNKGFMHSQGRKILNNCVKITVMRDAQY